MPSFTTIIGHELSVQRLRAAISNKAVSHAYLFAGPSGVGKTTTALAFAGAINCENSRSSPGMEIDSCGICRSCRTIDAGSHPDVHIVQPLMGGPEAEGGDRRPSAEIRIDQARELIRKLSLSPSMGRRKIFIVSPGDSMNSQAQNALLKSLEEPPAFSTLILCAESAESMLTTIRSRCQVIPFGLTQPAVIQRCLCERFQLSDAEVKTVAAWSQGRVGRALRMAGAPDWRAARTRLMDQLEAAIKGGPLQALQSALPLRDAAQKLPVTMDGGAGEGLVSEKIAPKLQMQALLEEMANLMRDLVIVKSVGIEAAEDLLINLDRKDSLAAFANRHRESLLRSSLDAVLTAQDLFRRNVNPQLLLEDLLLEFTFES